MPAPTPEFLNEPPNRPRITREAFAVFCGLGDISLKMTGMFRVWLTDHFSSARTIENATGPTGYPTALARKIWTTDSKTTGIAIESVTQWKPELVEHRPGIIIKRNEYKVVRLGIDNRMQGTMAKDAQNRYSNIWQGSHTLFCIAGEGAEVELLATEVARELNQFGPAVRKFIDLMRYDLLGVGEVMKLSQDGQENFVVPVTVGYAAREDWIIDQEAPLMKRFIFDLSKFRI